MSRSHQYSGRRSGAQYSSCSKTTKSERRPESLSSNALCALQTKCVGLLLFWRFNTRNPQLKRKKQQKVSVKCGPHCTLETAIDYIDDLTELLIHNSIAPDLVKVEPGVGKGDVDLSRIWPEKIRCSRKVKRKMKTRKTVKKLMQRSNRCHMVAVSFSNFWVIFKQYC